MVVQWRTLDKTELLWVELRSLESTDVLCILTWQRWNVAGYGRFPASVTSGAWTWLRAICSQDWTTIFLVSTIRMRKFWELLRFPVRQHRERNAAVFRHFQCML
jgi:hypothetical protein